MRMLRRHSPPDSVIDLLDKRGRRVQLVRLEGFPGFQGPQQGPPPTVFQETGSGLLRVVYREMVIRFQPRVSGRRRRDILKRHGLGIRRANAFIPGQVVVHLPDRSPAGEELVEISNELIQLEEVVMATPNFISQYRRQASPFIPPQEWHLSDLNIAAAWKITTGRPEIVVAVLDDGVDVEHPNLRASLWKSSDPGSRDRIGRDFYLPDSDPDHFNPRPKRFRFPFDQVDGNDIHGTCCAGLIAARGLNGGSVGVAPGCRILPVKIFHGDRLVPDERVADAICYAARHADILSCSWTCGVSEDVRLALEDAGQGRGERGSAMFCAAGNDGGAVRFPARDPNAIAVGASTDQARRAGYSNAGPELSLVAPSDGGMQGVFTTDVSFPGRGFNPGTVEGRGADRLHTNSFGGTSAATPLAAGVGALVLSVCPSLTREELKGLLEATADKIGGPFDARGHSNELGFGRVNAGRAVSEARR